MSDIQAVVDSTADARVREEALDIQRSFIVQAPAGSGKTELLIQRVLKLLAKVNAPEEILAITFTRKAAGEMQNRVVKALERARNEIPPDKSHDKLTWELAREVLKQDSLKQWDLSRNPMRLKIQTIDSFNAALIRAMPWISRTGGHPGILDSASELYEETVDNLLEKLDTDKALSPHIQNVLRYFDNNAGAFRRHVVNLLATRDQWRKYITGIREGDYGVREQLEITLQHAIAEGLEKLCNSAPTILRNALPPLAACAAENIEDTDSKIRDCKNLRALPGNNPEVIPIWRGIRNLLLTGKGEWRKPGGINKKIGFPTDMKEEKAGIQSLLEALAANENDSFREHLAAVDFLPSPKYSDAHWEILQSIVRVLESALRELQNVFRRRNAVDYSEIAFAAHRALSDEYGPTTLALALEYKIQHILVDEFQDTSYSQYQLLELLTEGWAADDGHTLFLVGDPMQSIYRFREAEVGLFLRAWENRRINNVPLTPLSLLVNFRSQLGIVEWVNATFSQILSQANDAATGAVAYSECVASKEREDGNAVVVHPFIGSGHSAEAREVVKIIKSELNENNNHVAIAGESESNPNTIAVLVRSRSHLERIVAELKKNRIPFRAVEIDKLGERQIVQDLLALTKAMLHPADRTAWLAALRAPLCGLTLADLLIIAGKDKDRTIPDLLGDPSILGTLSEDGSARVKRTMQSINKRLRNRRRAPLRRWIEGLWIELGGLMCVTESGLSDARAFFDMLETLEEGGDISTFDVLENEVENLYAPPDPNADESLQIMTIHKAKGLQFDVVILPGLNRIPRMNEEQLLRWEQRTTREGDPIDVLIAAKPESGRMGEGSEDTTFEHLKDLQSKKEENEISRLLYVAATRAKKRLYLLGTAQTTIDSRNDGVKLRTQSKSFLKRLWSTLELDFMKALKRFEETRSIVAEESDAVMIQTQIKRLPAGWEIPVFACDVETERIGTALSEVEADTDVFDIDFKASEPARIIGTVVHRFLQLISEEGIDKWTESAIGKRLPLIRTALQTEGLGTGTLEEAASRVSNALLNTLNDEKGRWILSRHAEAAAELDLTGYIDGKMQRIKIDRTFVADDGTRWIVDYKTSAHEGSGIDEFVQSRVEAYHGQIDLYVRLMRNYDPRPVRAGLYFPMLNVWRELEMPVL